MNWQDGSKHGTVRAMSTLSAPTLSESQNRLLTWLPQILKTLEIDPFPVHQVESQLTAEERALGIGFREAA